MNQRDEAAGRTERRRSLRALILAAAGAAALLLASVGAGQAGVEQLAGTGVRAAPSEAPNCRVFPADNAWNQRVDALPVHPGSAAWVKSIGETERLRALFSASDGIPYQVVAGSTAPVTVEMALPDESDPGPFRLRDDVPVDAGAGRVLVLDRDRCLLAELRGAERRGPAAWTATAGAVFDLGSNDLRPDGWGSADPSGLPVFPGLARLDEVDTGEVGHALRFSAPRIAAGHLWPARHGGPDGNDPDVPPAGTRFRLRSTVNPAAFSPRARVILTALQQYGMILAEPGPAWGLSGAPNPGWDEASLAELEDVFGASFEAVDVSSLVIDGGSGQSAPPPTPTPTGTLPATKTPGPTSTPLPTTTPEPSATITLTPTTEPTETPKPTGTPKPTKTPAPTDTPVPTATSTQTPAPTVPTATFTVTPTNTPAPTVTPTLVPTVNPSCVPRPAMLFQSEASGSGRLRVTIESKSGFSVPDNSLHSLRVVALANASVEIENVALRTPGAQVDFDEYTVAIRIFVQRDRPREAFAATLGVTDDCGEWQTWVGAGPDMR